MKYSISRGELLGVLNTHAISKTAQAVAKYLAILRDKVNVENVGRVERFALYHIHAVRSWQRDTLSCLALFGPYLINTLHDGMPVSKEHPCQMLPPRLQARS